MEIAVAFGRVLRRLRLEQKISQEELAGNAGLQRKYISLLEKAQYQPKLTTVFSLASALNMKPSEFIALVDEESKKIIRKEIKV